MPSAEWWARECDRAQRVADARRVEDVNRRDERPWVVGLTCLFILGLLVLLAASFGMVETWL